ncbi:MAG TPA: DUF92 domain-containing protein [Ktedonobacteraceae bacterium]|jgi:uncharacterized protein (TIGR00297 family)|nr:DUF92 domain-containing protein [Ktedonobacteraceae bacterium]
MSTHRRTHPNAQSKAARLLLGLALSSGIGLLAYKRRSLTKGGAAGAVATGTTIFGLGGWPWGISLIYFFLSSTLLSHFREKEKASTAADKFSKGSQRDLAQVLANGGVASFYAAAASTTRSEALQQTLQAGFVGALATATADTWATEIGVLSPHQPRLLTTGQPVAPGTSGGITLSGSIASALGAFTLGLVSWATQSLRKSRASLPFVALLSGLTGSLCDSLLGATVQAMSFCPHCQRETERAIHACGTRTRPLRGISWCNNDVVNALASLAGSLTAIVLHCILRPASPSQKRTASGAEL